MTVTGGDLLRLLGSGVRPDGALPRRAHAADHAGFADLLARVRAGEVSSGLGVEVAPGAKVELSRGQLDRLAVALDAAEARGYGRILALIDGRVLAIDVPGRMVLGEHRPGEARFSEEYDAVVSVPGGSAREAKALFAVGRSAKAAPPAGPFALRNASLAEAIAPPAARLPGES